MSKYRYWATLIVNSALPTAAGLKAAAAAKCPFTSDGLATSPSFLLVFAALSMTLLGMHNPLE
jgi:hypothetical protein